ncbi:hypothetical protein NPIL_461271, partial [Nephila pilipes]
MVVCSQIFAPENYILSVMSEVGEARIDSESSHKCSIIHAFLRRAQKFTWKPYEGGGSINNLRSCDRLWPDV